MFIITAAMVGSTCRVSLTSVIIAALLLCFLYVLPKEFTITGRNTNVGTDNVGGVTLQLVPPAVSSPVDYHAIPGRLILIFIFLFYFLTSDC